MVTGGRGFIGRALVKVLSQSGHHTISVDQTSIEGESTQSPLLREVRCDITDAQQLRKIFESASVTAVVHLAAILPTAARLDPLRATQVNIQSSLQLLEMARQVGVKRFLFGSSLSVYGSYPANQVVSEADHAAPEDLYGASKLYVEQAGWAYRERYTLEFVSLRVGRVLGPGAQSKTSAWRSQIFELLETPQPAEILIPYIASERVLLLHVNDLASMFAALLHAPSLKHALYNAPCESVVVGDLKRAVEALNPRVQVKLGEEFAASNPRLLDAARFRREFAFQALPILEQLSRSARK